MKTLPKPILKGKSLNDSQTHKFQPKESLGHLVQRIGQDFQNFQTHFSHSLGSQRLLVQDYVQNLQQQSEVLHKENQHLKRKLLEITQQFPAMETESMKNVENHRLLQRRTYELELEEVRKDGLIHYLTEEIESLAYQVKTLENERRRTVAASLGDCKQVETSQEELERSLKRMEEQIYEVKLEKAHFQGQNNYWEAKLHWLEHQLQTYQKEGEQLRQALEENEVEKSSVMKRLEVQELCSKDILHHQYPSGIEITTLRDEIASLRNKVKAVELEVETDRLNRLKLENNRTQLTQENAELLARVADAVQHLDLEKSLQSHTLIRCSDEHIRRYAGVKDSINILLRMREQLGEEVKHIQEKNNALRFSTNEWESLYFEKKGGEPLPQLARRQAEEMEALKLQAEIDTLKEQLVTFDRLMQFKSIQFGKLCSRAETLEHRLSDFIPSNLQFTSSENFKTNDLL